MSETWGLADRPVDGGEQPSLDLRQLDLEYPVDQTETFYHPVLIYPVTLVWLGYVERQPRNLQSYYMLDADFQTEQKSQTQYRK